ncbi:MAG: DUF3782 domain-containing protein [Thaumarchaeota archaeon]|nr:DUF3782 domain-containing protein [Nitrososphaerota archaeon]
MVESLTREERLRFLRALEEDAEFRYAVAGAVGILTVVEELRRLREDFNRLAELEEKRWEEAYRRFEAIERRLEEHTRILGEHTKILGEHTRVLGEHARRLEELTKVVGELKVVVGSLGRRLGRDLERTILELYRYALKEMGVEVDRVERFTYRDVDGRYYRRGAVIEVDVYTRDKATYLVEVKSHADRDDVEWFYEKAGVVERILGRKADRLILVAVNIDREALERARELGVDVVYGGVVE